MIFSVAESNPQIIRRALPARDWSLVNAKVLNLKEHWFEAFRFDRFYTLGKTQYLMSADKIECPPADEAAALSSLLHSHFSDLYQDVKEVLNEIVSAECVWDNRLWTPGFHLFPCSPEHKKQVSRPHCDLNFASIDWGKLEIEGEIGGMFSFTIPVHIADPREFGIKMWNCSYKDALREFGQSGYSPEKVTAHLQKFEVTNVNYNIGEMIIHSGRFFHEVLPFSGSDGDYRTTMQGHAVFKAGRWYVFW